jgi:hypothetical protein
MISLYLISTAPAFQKAKATVFTLILTASMKRANAPHYTSPARGSVADGWVFYVKPLKLKRGIFFIF